jgi:hypothetical protein
MITHRTAFCAIRVLGAQLNLKLVNFVLPANFWWMRPKMYRSMTALMTVLLAAKGDIRPRKGKPHAKFVQVGRMQTLWRRLSANIAWLEKH